MVYRIIWGRPRTLSYLVRVKTKPNTFVSDHPLKVASTEGGNVVAG